MANLKKELAIFLINSTITKLLESEEIFFKKKSIRIKVFMMDFFDKKKKLENLIQFACNLYLKNVQFFFKKRLKKFRIIEEENNDEEFNFSIIKENTFKLESLVNEIFDKEGDLIKKYKVFCKNEKINYLERDLLFLVKNQNHVDQVFMNLIKQSFFFKKNYLDLKEISMNTLCNKNEFNQICEIMRNYFDLKTNFFKDVEPAGFKEIKLLILEMFLKFSLKYNDLESDPEGELLFKLYFYVKFFFTEKSVDKIASIILTIRECREAYSDTYMYTYSLLVTLALVDFYNILDQKFGYEIAVQDIAVRMRIGERFERGFKIRQQRRRERLKQIPKENRKIMKRLKEIRNGKWYK